MSLEEARKRAKQEWEALWQGNTAVVLVGTATCGRSAGALDTLAELRAALEEAHATAEVIETGCLGLCYTEPIVAVKKPGGPVVWYGEVSAQRARELVTSYLVADNPLPERALGTTGDGRLKDIPPLDELPVMKRQVRRVLARCGLIDPTRIEHYLATGGYTGIQKALQIGPEAVVEEVKQSGLRGRGGAGFPTWRKWQFSREAPGQPKYLVCNADEGDPGAFMNRSVLEGDPHAVLEGMLIAAYAIGAREGYIYCRAEYPLALERLRLAIAQMRELGLLGENILGSGFCFDIHIKEGAGAFVCGEETALIASIEGRRGMPTTRPPYPAVSGLWGKPTVINNVETLASVSLILQNSAEWFAQYGTEKSKGTKTFALVGKIRHTGLIEVPLGITLREVIFDIGGGIVESRQFKAVQTGGPSGGCLPAALLDSPVDYESLTAAGAIMGSGGMVVMDERTCMVDLARFFLTFTQRESCGKCVPCRLGTKQMLTILEDITQGRGKPGDIDLLMDLASAVKAGSLCGLGQTAPNPVLTTIRYFREEYEAHVVDGRCPSLVCKSLVSYRILPEKCIGCMLCLKACPSGAIKGALKQKHEIDQSKCIKCGACLLACPQRIRAVECVPGRLTA